MIKRQSPNSKVPSLVNSAQNEHFNVVDAVKANAPIVSTTSVVKSINFEAAPDGSFELRQPLILKERLEQDTYYLYDHIHKLECVPTPDGQHLRCVLRGGDSTTSIILQWYNRDTTFHSETLSTVLDDEAWIIKVQSVYNTPEYSIASVVIDVQGFESGFREAYLTYETLPQIRRLLKISKDIDATSDRWIVQILYPEFNSITSGTDVGNAESLDINLLLDNPYATRDLYNYGFFSATKILSYVQYNLDKSLNDMKVYELTENSDYFKVLVSGNPIDLFHSDVILKAFITTAKSTALKYYCCWEESINGIDWKVCPEFINKFSTHQNPSLQLTTQLVSDMTSEDFEKIAYDESLEKAASYLVSKQMVQLNVTDTLSETDNIKDRPDILKISASSYNKCNRSYRFVIYVDSGKSTPIPDVVKKKAAKSYFENANTTDEYIDADEKFQYETVANFGYDSETYVEGTSVNFINAKYDNGFIILHESSDASKKGNSLVITNLDENRKIKSIKFTIGPSIIHLDDEGGETTYYTEFKSKIKGILNGDKNLQIEKTLLAGEAFVYEVPEGTVFNSMEIYNDSVNLDLDEDTELYQYRTKIQSIEIRYEVSPDIQSTSTYVASQTGIFKIPYSNTNVFLEPIEYLREQLFTGKTYYFNEQLFFYKKNSVFMSTPGSSIVKLMNSMSFGTNVTKIMAWRNYLLIFTEDSIVLAKYDLSSGTYTTKIISNSIGVSQNDAETVAVILNSIYFKSKYKVYKLVPNLYSTLDDTLNVHSISDSIDPILEDLLSTSLEMYNFGYSSADDYNVFVPISEFTYKFTYDVGRKLWTIQRYPFKLTGVEQHSHKDTYLRNEVGLYYFKDNLQTLLNNHIVYQYDNIGYVDEDSNKHLMVAYEQSSVICMHKQITDFNRIGYLYQYLPYGDYQKSTLLDIYDTIVNDNNQDWEVEDFLIENCIPIPFEIDFGQKSSNYTLDKQYLESKLIFSSEHPKDVFPVSLDITTDGIQRPLHWDANTDSALWKTDFHTKGTLNTDFAPTNVDSSGIFRQLIVKYSGKGKTIRHLIKGESKSKFKFYSMDVRSRTLPNKQ